MDEEESCRNSALGRRGGGTGAEFLGESLNDRGRVTGPGDRDGLLQGSRHLFEKGPVLGVGSAAIEDKELRTAGGELGGKCAEGDAENSKECVVMLADNEVVGAASREGDFGWALDGIGCTEPGFCDEGAWAAVLRRSWRKCGFSRTSAGASPSKSNT